MPELRDEVISQLSELSIPKKHLELIKHLLVLTREKAKKQLDTKYVEATAVTNADKGSICLVPDFRFTLAHELGHLVWKKLLPQEVKNSFGELNKKENAEWERIIGKAMRKFYPEFFYNLDPRSEKLEEEFCWFYSFYLCMQDCRVNYPKVHAWFKQHVFSGRE